jgi:hypothetical protein
MRAPEAAHDARLAGDGALGVVDTGNAVEFRTREIEMAVAGDDGIDARDGSERDRGILEVFRPLLLADAGVGQGDDDVCAFLAHLRHPGFGRLDDVAGGGVAGQMPGVPGHDLGRDEADQADPDLVLSAGAIRDGAVEDHVGLEEKVVIARVFSQRPLGQIGADHGEIGAVYHLEHEIEAVIELVVAQRSAIIAEHVHCGDDRVNVALLHAALIGDVIAHGIALQEVAIVNKHRILRLGADLVDDRGGAGQAHGIVGFVAIIVIGEDVDVKVGGLHDAQMGLVGIRPCGERMNHDQSACGGKSAEQRAARDRVQHFKKVLVFHGLSPCR